MFKLGLHQQRFHRKLQPKAVAVNDGVRHGAVPQNKTTAILARAQRVNAWRSFTASASLPEADCDDATALQTVWLGTQAEGHDMLTSWLKH